MITEARRLVGRLKKWLVIVIAAIIIYNIFNRKKVFGSQEFENYLLSVEGKKSSNRSDSASSCHSGFHTNRGITFCTWVSERKKLGLSQDYETFLNMTLSQWSEIVTQMYFENPSFTGLKALHDKMPTLAKYCIDWCFNHGNGGFERRIAPWQRTFYGVVDNDITKPEIFSNFLSYSTDEDQLLVELYFLRKKVYEEIARKNPEKRQFLKGWINRINKFYNLFANKNVLDRIGNPTYY